MVLEAIKQIEVRLRGGVLSLSPGQRVEAPDAIASALIEQAKGKVRAVPDWLIAWRKVADSVYGITADDHRLLRILDAIGQCDEAFTRGDWGAFTRGAEAVRHAVEGRT